MDAYTYQHMYVTLPLAAEVTSIVQVLDFVPLLLLQFGLADFFFPFSTFELYYLEAIGFKQGIYCRYMCMYTYGIHT